MKPISKSGSGLDPKRRVLFEKLLRQETGDATATSTIARRATVDQAPLSFAQERLWFLDQLEPNSALYNIPIALHLDGELDREALEGAIALKTRQFAKRQMTWFRRESPAIGLNSDDLSAPEIAGHLEKLLDKHLTNLL